MSSLLDTGTLKPTTVTNTYSYVIGGVTSDYTVDDLRAH